MQKTRNVNLVNNKNTANGSGLTQVKFTLQHVEVVASPPSNGLQQRARVVTFMASGNQGEAEELPN